MSTPPSQHGPDVSASSFDSATYGRSFADVYDSWYAHRDPNALIECVAGLSSSQSLATVRALELGAGTGRVALPLAAAGVEVTALDTSEDMLAVLAAKPGAERVRMVQGNAGDATTYPSGPFDVVIAAFNLVCNLSDRACQQRCFDAVASRLAPQGRFIVEAFVPDAPAQRRRDLVTRSIDAESVVLIATDTDPATSSISGAHLEFRDGSVRVRPWKVCYASPEQLDSLARAAGLVLEHRWADPTGTPFSAGEHAEHCSIYRRADPFDSP